MRVIVRACIWGMPVIAKEAAWAGLLDSPGLEAVQLNSALLPGGV